jgi:hypothetical protein
MSSPAPAGARFASTGAAAIAAVILYRIVSAWDLVPLGWGLRRTMPNGHRAQLEPTVVRGVTHAAHS